MIALIASGLKTLSGFISRLGHMRKFPVILC